MLANRHASPLLPELRVRADVEGTTVVSNPSQPWTGLQLVSIAFRLVSLCIDDFFFFSWWMANERLADVSWCFMVGS